MSLYGILVDTPTHDALEHPVQQIVGAINEAQEEGDFLDGKSACGMSPDICESCQ